MGICRSKSKIIYEEIAILKDIKFGDIVIVKNNKNTSQMIMKKKD